VETESKQALYTLAEVDFKPKIEEIKMLTHINRGKIPSRRHYDYKFISTKYWYTQLIKKPTSRYK
jgi:hypothetical protein